MQPKTKLVFVASAFLTLVGMASCGSSGGNSSTGSTCTPNATQACLCPGGTMGVQSCNADGKTLTVCNCSDATTSSSTTGGHGGATSSTASTAAGTGGAGTCGDGIIEPSDHCNDPGSEFYCKQDCMNAGTGGAGGSGGACAGHVYYAGRYDNMQSGITGNSVWANLPGAGGLTGLDAGNNQCKALNIGADHVCDYTEVVAAFNAGEAAFMAIPQGTSAWVERTTTVNLVGTMPVAMGGTASAPGPGGRCNDWTYQTNHISDGEYVTFDSAGTPTFHLDNDTIFDPSSANPVSPHTIPGDLQCGGTIRSILCCFTACM